jgi:hypothetical protein
MTAADEIHSPTPEEIMEYLDGEGTVAARTGIESHLALCGACQVFAAGHRRLSGDLGAWQVEGAPASLRVPKRGRAGRFAIRRPAWLSVRRITIGAAAAAAVAAFAFFSAATREQQAAPVTDLHLRTMIGGPEPSSPDANALARRLRESNRADSFPLRAEALVETTPLGGIQAPSAAGETTARKPAIVRTAALRIVTNDFGAGRPTIERIVAAAGGFVDKMTVMGDPGSARMLRGTLRIPSDRLGEVAERLRALGQVTEDTQGTEDVTDQLVDLDVRLRSARATELRLTELLRKRTGTLADVLEVERELARVRVDIERLDAETANVGRRVSYATLTIDLAEERKAGLQPGALSLGTQVRIAAANGLASAVESLTWSLLSILEALPFLLLWSVILGAGWLIVRRAWAWSARHSH